MFRSNDTHQSTRQGKQFLYRNQHSNPLTQLKIQDDSLQAEF